MCVTITRSTGRPSSVVANTCSHCARGLVVRDAAVDDGPALAAVDRSSRSSQRLMWSSANGSAMRIQRTPGATSSAVAGRGQGVAEGVVRVRVFERRSSAHAVRLHVYVNVKSEPHCRPPAARPLSPAATSHGHRDLHDQRAGARVRPHDAGHPLLRGHGPAAAAARAGRATASTARATARG